MAADELVAKLATTPPEVMEVGDWDLVGALIVAADRSPIEAVKAVIGSYRDLELVEVAAALEAVGTFIREGS